jgi:hypothetical protein
MDDFAEDGEYHMDNVANDNQPHYISRRGVDYANLEPPNSNILFKIRLRYWYTSLLVILTVLILVMIGSVSTPRWSSQGKGGEKWRSGILKCGGCQGRWENKYISEILKQAKDNDIKGWEATFDRLYTGGIIYVLFESLTLLMCAVWIAYIAFLLSRKRLFTELGIYIVIILTLVFHTAAIAGWFGSTQAGFNKDCEKIPGYEDDDFDICATHGPAMAISIEIFLFIIAVLFLFVFRNRRRSVKTSDNKAMNAGRY